MGKVCSKCLQEKSEDRFSPHKGTLDKLNTFCKDCVNEYSREYYLKNKNKYKKRNIQWYKQNKEKHGELMKAWREKKKNLRETDPEAYILYREKENKKNRKWAKKNPAKWKAIQDRKRRKLRSTAHGKLRHNMSSLIARRLKRRLSQKKASLMDFLPYTIEQLKVHLESHFLPGMSWDNYGRWHIDHRIPDCSFDYISVTDEAFQQCWSLENLQPLWKKDNLEKGRNLPV